MHADAYPWRFKSPGAHTFTEKDAEDLLTNPGYFAFLAFDGSAPIGYLVSRTRSPEIRQATINDVDRVGARFSSQGLLRSTWEDQLSGF